MKILAVGIATLDIINTVENYPEEDDEVRAISQRRARGGNATNTLAVLSQFGHQGFWAGSLPSEDPVVELVKASLLGAGIDLEYVHYLRQGKLPTSYITLSRSSGSRSIVHFREISEYRAEWFEEIPLETFDWVHFEGRAVEHLAPMLHLARKSSVARISLEVEKPRAGIEALFDMPDLLLFGSAYARSRGCNSARQLLEEVSTQLGESTPQLVCSWGEHGAWGIDSNGELIYAPAMKIEAVDTVGAGDTFNAAIIDALLKGYSLESALSHACLNAGRKCEQEGVESLRLRGCDGKTIPLPT